MARKSTDDLVKDLRIVIDRYRKRISNAECVGALEYIKREIMDESLNEEDK